MIERATEAEVKRALGKNAAVGLLGPRQVGKTTLAEAIARAFEPTPIYLDLESPEDLAKLGDPGAYFRANEGRLIILDEVQRAPELFAVLRGVIDRRRRRGLRTAQFLILGSASLDLLRQSSESLAGRIAYTELTGLTAEEIGGGAQPRLSELWLRGGFPDSFLAGDDRDSLDWRRDFIRTYLERDVPQLGPRIPATVLRRLWTMLAHLQGGQLNTAQLGGSLGLSAPTARRYVELLEDLLLVRMLRPWSRNVGKRLVKSPKVYLRDSGLTHALLGLETLDDLLGHPVAGPSWEGFVIENLLSCLPKSAEAWFYRTAAGAEIDLVIQRGQAVTAIEIKRSSAPTVSKGFYLGCADIGASARFVVYPGEERFPLGKDTEAISLVELMALLHES
ncbi:ATPase [Cephaloticoccus capnophilus]|uniref:ATPase n=1 Tax=Cephaloticoccus capnophilus TaxID=1548208 RepID=A0A139SK02_9BACT|nr:ATP-binding protein [Cephaloticoccus capnophilus]KXU34814.1 ATPase [Cephaloticoccus capnophilus]